MNKFIGLTRRNLLIFFKDKQSVIFSLMTSIIVFCFIFAVPEGDICGCHTECDERSAGTGGFGAG